MTNIKFSQYSKETTWRNLQQASLATLKPFQLQLMDSEQPLYCEEFVRVLPGKRLVAFGHWAGKEVVAKLFFAPRQATRHIARDVQGINGLKTAGVLTPTIYFQGVSQDKHIQVLLFERIKGLGLDDIWRLKQDVEEVLPLMHAVTLELATQHVLGILQHDLHFKNFLIKGKNIYTLDGGEVEISHTPLDKKESLNNLGLFCAQLGVEAKGLMQILFQTYAKSRGWLIKKQDIDDLKSAMLKHSKKRWKNFRKKIMRTCSAFVRVNRSTGITLYDRSYESVDLLNCLKNPDTVFSATDTVMLKEGRSATVAKIYLKGKPYVMKRYNIKNATHGLRRSLRATRAAMGWQLGQHLILMGVATAKPIAFIEKRFLGLRARSYLLMEYIEGENAGEFFAHDDENALPMAKKIVTLFENLAQLNLTHGDLKKTNILMRDHTPVFIDLDGMKEHRTKLGFKRAFQQEMKRFMLNWRNQPKTYKLFEELLNQ